MKVYVVNDCRNYIIWGVFSSKENAIKFLKFMDWCNNENVELSEYEVDEKIKRCNL